MKRINFIQVQKDDQEHIQKLVDMWIQYIKEIDPNNQDSELELEQDVIRRVNIQGKRSDMHLELFFELEHLIGFAFYAVDLGGIKNVIDANLGYIMEFYVLPQYRRKGHGTTIFEHIESTFFRHDIKQIYLTPSEVEGEAFWQALGFENSGKIDPDNKMPIYIKEIVER